MWLCPNKSARSALIIGALALAGCGASKAPAAPAKPGLEPLHLAPLTDLVSPANVQSVVIARPFEMLQQPALARVFHALVPAKNLKRFSTYIGASLQDTEQFVWADYGEDQLFLLKLPHQRSKTLPAFERRLTSELKRRQKRPDLHFVGGKIGFEYRRLASFDGEVIGYQMGRGKPILVAMAFAKGRLEPQKSALRREPLKTLLPWAKSASVAWLMLPPADGSWDRAGHGLGKYTQAVGFAAWPAGKRQIKLKVRVEGLWGKGENPQALQRLRVTVHDLETSSLGQVLGLKGLANRATFRALTDRPDGAVEAQATLDSEALAKGAFAITRASLKELFQPADAPKTAPPLPNAPPPADASPPARAPGLLH